MHFFAPPLPPKRPKGRIRRVLSVMGWGSAATFGLIVALALYLASSQLVSTPQGLYHRTWQMTRALIFDPTQLKNWDAWEHKFDGQIHSDEDAVRFANEMLKSLKDPFTRLADRDQVRREVEQLAGNYTGVGITLGVQMSEKQEPVTKPDGQPLAAADADGYPLIKEVKDGGPAKLAGLKAGDAIKSINGEDTRGKGLMDVVTAMRGNENTQVKLVIRRDGADLPEMTLTRATLNLPAVTYRTIGGDIGYIHLESFSQDDADQEMAQALDALSGTRALILDLRGNPGGLVDQAIKIASLFLDEGRVVTITQRIPFMGHQTTHYELTRTELLHKSSVDGAEASVAGGGRLPNLSGNKPLIILVDGGSASASEMFTGALKDHKRAIVVGERTVGKGIGQSVVPMPNGTRLHVTSLRYYTPNGTWLGDAGITVASGIVPDHVVKANKGLERGSANDNQLEFAVRLLTP